MRVLHVIPSVSTRRGGPSEAIFPMVAAQRQLGIDAEIATTNDHGPDLLDVPLLSLIDWRGAPTRFFPRYSPPLAPLREFAYAPAFRPWLKAHLANYDLLHIHAIFSYLSTAAMRSARRAGTPYLNRPLGQLGRWPLAQHALRKKIYLAAIEARNLRAAAALHYTSAPERDEARSGNFTIPGFVIPHGVDIPPLIPGSAARLRTQLHLPPAQKIILFLGRLHPKKGLDLLIPAVRALQRSDTTLIIIGDGSPAYLRELDLLLHRLPFAAPVLRLSPVTGDARQLFLQGADLFVLPSRHENFGLTVIESLAAGTPVLVSDQVALAEQIERHHLGRAVPLRIEALTHALHDLLFTPSTFDAGRLRRFARDHFSWERNARALGELYCTIGPKMEEKNKFQPPP